MVSVIVPIYNAEPYLAGLLENLGSQVVSEPWEVVAVDNGSSDRSRQVAESFSDRLSIRIKQAIDRRNPSFARNIGARFASGEKLLFIDADDQISEDYVDHMARALNRHDFVTSRVDSISLNAPWIQAAHGPAWQTDEVGTFFDFLPAAGVNVGVRRELFESLQGFPEEFSGSEDMAFSWLAQLAGAKIHLVHEAVYQYRYRDSLAGLFHQARNWGRDNVLLYTRFRRHGMPGRNFRQGLLDWYRTGRGLATARGRSSLAPAVVRAGFCAGRLGGSIRYRVWYSLGLRPRSVLPVSGSSRSQEQVVSHTKRSGDAPAQRVIHRPAFDFEVMAVLLQL